MTAVKDKKSKRLLTGILLKNSLKFLSLQRIMFKSLWRPQSI